MSVVSITKAEVPEYLTGSDFHNSLSSDDDEEFSISNIYLKMTPEVHTPDDLSHLLHTLQYWGLSKWPNTIFAFLATKLEHELRTQVKEILAQFEENFHLSELFADLQKAKSTQSVVDAAVKCGRRDVLHNCLNLDVVYRSSSMVVKCAAENGLIEVLKCKCDELTSKGAEIPLSQVSLSKVAGGGHTECLRFLFTTLSALTNGCKAVSNVCLAAAENGHFECLKLARDHGCSWNTQLANAAALHGHAKCLEYALKKRCPVGCTATVNAVKHKHMDCLKLLLEYGAPLTKATCAAAAHNGDMPCLLFLLERGGSVGIASAKEAASEGHLECLQFLLHRGCPANSTAADGAASEGHLECLQFLLDRGCPVDCTAADGAASGGHLQCLALLLERGHKASSKGLHGAAMKGSVDCVRMLHANGVQLESNDLVDVIRFPRTTTWCTYIRCLVEGGYTQSSNVRFVSTAVQWGNTDAVESMCTLAQMELQEEDSMLAIKNNDFGMMKLLYSHGCPLSERVCAAAAKNKFSAMLKFLRAIHCPWDATTTAAAAQHSSVECLQYAVERRCPLSADACELAAERRDNDNLKYLYSIGMALTLKTSAAAVRARSMECLKYCVEHGAPLDANLCALAAYRPRESLSFDDVAMLLYLHSTARCPWDARTCTAAAAAGRRDLLTYAHGHGCPWDKETSRAARNSANCLRYCMVNGCPMDKETMKIFNQKNVHNLA